MEIMHNDDSLHFHPCFAWSSKSLFYEKKLYHEILNIKKSCPQKLVNEELHVTKLGILNIKWDFLFS